MSIFMKKRYKIISEDLQKNLIEFLDEIQFEAAGNNDKESMHIINFCSWAIKELLDSYDGYLREEPKKKSRDQYVDETFMDWNLPEMSDEEYEKLACVPAHPQTHCVQVGDGRPRCGATSAAARRGWCSHALRARRVGRSYSRPRQFAPLSARSWLPRRPCPRSHPSEDTARRCS